MALQTDPLEKLLALNPRQRSYVQNRSMGMLPTQAALQSGYRKDESKRLEKLDGIAQALAALQEATAKDYNLSRNDVVEGIIEGIDVCRLQADGVGMINGWEKLARICGIAAPDKKELTLTIDGEIAQRHYTTLSEQDLLALVGKERALETTWESVEDDSDALE